MKPKFTAAENKLLQKAIHPAILDRQSFVDAYYPDAENSAVKEALIEIKNIAELKNKKLDDLSEAENEAARLAFIYAESWDGSFADSCRGSIESKEAQKSADAFRKTRIKLWGRTHFEVNLNNATSVSIFDILKNKTI
jgi:hypothetical protein